MHSPTVDTTSAMPRIRALGLPVPTAIAAASAEKVVASCTWTVGWERKRPTSPPSTVATVMS